MIAPHIGDIYATIANVNVSQEKAHTMIEEACKSAAEQIRTECWRRWRAEHDYQAHQDIIRAEQKQHANEVSAHREREAEISRKRNEELLKAEAMPPARKRNGGW